MNLDALMETSPLNGQRLFCYFVCDRDSASRSSSQGSQRHLDLDMLNISLVLRASQRTQSVGRAWRAQGSSSRAALLWARTRSRAERASSSSSLNSAAPSSRWGRAFGPLARTARTVRTARASLCRSLAQRRPLLPLLRLQVSGLWVGRVRPGVIRPPVRG